VQNPDLRQTDTSVAPIRLKHKDLFKVFPPYILRRQLFSQKEYIFVNIPDFLEKNARIYPNRTALLYRADGRRSTYLELQERTYRLCNGLIEFGVRKGDRVAIIQENCFEWLELYVGIGKIGAVVTPLNSRLLASEFADLINHSEASTVILGKKFLDAIRPLMGKMPSVKTYILLGDESEGCVGYDKLLATSSNDQPEVAVSRDDLFCLLYTGGTTGKPKGVMLTHDNLFAACVTNLVEWRITHDDVNMIVTPLFHVGSSWPLFSGFMMGNRQIVLATVDFKEMFETIERERVTWSLWLSAIVGGVINNRRLDEYDLSSLRLVITGGGPLAEAQLRRLFELLKCHVFHGGGQTEVGIVTAIRLEEHIEGPPERLGSAGQEAFNVQIRVVDEHDNEVRPGEVGELCARGDAVMAGYWRMPEETAKSLKGGWQHTGDLVKIDAEGYIYYVDRLKDMIKSGGENVYSKEVEDVIYTLPQIAEVAVIGVPDEKWGEAVKAIVIAKPGERITEGEVVSHCRERLAKFKCPKTVDFRDRFPKTGLGKIAKNILREEYWKGFSRRIH
jgi:acyl-CoA synthetase (AMP-forming)/AMP-acid ligase II